MPATHTSPKSRGFTLLELVVVIAIIAILVALLLPVLNLARKKAKASATGAMMHNLLVALDSYHNNYGIYPVQAGHSGQVIDSGAGNDPGYYNVPCAPVGSASTGAESAINGALTTLLIKNKYLDINTSTLQNGQVLMDYYGSPIVVRFLILLPGGNTQVVDKVTEKIYAWSYGYNMLNEINASTNFSNGAAPAYDTGEDQNLNSGNGGDDICTWR